MCVLGSLDRVTRQSRIVDLPWNLGLEPWAGSYMWFIPFSIWLWFSFVVLIVFVFFKFLASVTQQETVESPAGTPPHPRPTPLCAVRFHDPVAGQAWPYGWVSSFDKSVCFGFLGSPFLGVRSLHRVQDRGHP